MKIIQNIIDILSGRKEIMLAPSQKLILRRRQKRIKQAALDNKIDIDEETKKFVDVNISSGNSIKIGKSSFEGGKININIGGTNNSVLIQDGLTVQGILNINIYGDNCHITIDQNMFVGNGLNITLGQNHPFQGKINFTNLHIGENVRMEDVNITTFNSNHSISIGDNCLFSLKVNLYNTDGHPIYSKSSGKLVNHVSDMIIGSNCWIGYNVTILKNISLAEGTIVGWGSIVTKSFNKPFCAIAGNPAKIIKEDLDFKLGGDADYINNGVKND